jgi:tetratricopeptide (TPR) repeat protein
MAVRHALLAATVMILLLGGPRVQADDGKADPAKTAAPPQAAATAPKPEGRQSPEQITGTLSEALKLIQSLEKKPDKGEDGGGVPEPDAFNMGASKDVQADAVRAIGRAQAMMGDLPAARATWQSALDAAAESSIFLDTTKRARVCVKIAEAQFEAGDREEPRFTIRQALQATRSIKSDSRFPFMEEDLEPPPGVEERSPLQSKASLLCRLGRLQAKLGDVVAARETYRQAIEAAQAIKEPLDQVRGLLDVVEEAPTETAAATWSKALDIAMAQTEYVRAQAVSLILRARIKAGQTNEALSTITDRLQGDLRTYGIWVFADAVASSDAAIPAEIMDRLLQLAKKAEYDRPSKKLTVYQRLAEAQARLGAYEAAYRTVGEPHPANNVQDFHATYARIQIMLTVARSQLKAKQRDAAKDTVLAALELIAPLADEDAEAYFPLTELAKLLAEAGDFQGALRIANTLSRSASKVGLLAEIAEVQAQDKQEAAARQTIGRAIEAGRRAPNDAVWGLDNNFGGLDPMLPIHKAVAQAQARVGDLDAALKTLGEMGQHSFAHFSRQRAVEQIVTTRLDAGDVPGALRAADVIPQPQSVFQDDRAAMLERIARLQARRHNPAVILDWARKQKTPQSRLRLLRGLADGIADRFDPKASPSKPGDPAGQLRPRPTGP